MRKLREPLQNMRDCLHVIPWHELEKRTRQSIEKAVNIDDPFTEIRQNKDILHYALWKPPYPGWKRLHHLRTEEEVLQYCIAKDWTLPGHSGLEESKELTLFAMTPIEETPFLKSIHHFWDRWVCCSFLHMTPI